MMHAVTQGFSWERFLRCADGPFSHTGLSFLTFTLLVQATWL